MAQFEDYQNVDQEDIDDYHNIILVKIGAPQSGAALYYKEEWTNQDIRVYAKPPEGDYIVEMKTEESDGWQERDTITVSKNQTVQARVINRFSKKASDITEKDVLYIDKVNPTTTAPTLSSTSNSVIVNFKQEDFEETDISGVSGLNEDTIRFNIKKTDESKWDETKWQASGTFTNLEANTSYDIKTKVTDNAGNIAESTVATIKTDAVPTVATDGSSDTLKLTETPDSWTNTDVKVSATTNTSGYTMQMSTDGTNYNNVSSLTFSGNGTAYARLWDGYNGGSAASKAITNIDKSAPTITSAEVKNLSSTGYDVSVYGVTDNQSGVNRVAFPTWTDYNGQDEIQSNWWASGSSAVGENQGNGTWHYRVNTSSHNYEAGAYNTHVYVYDNQGNSACVWTTAITVPTVTAYFNGNGGSNGSAITKPYGQALGSLPSSGRTGYTFAGWFTAASGGSQISSSTTMPSGNTTYYAQWKSNTYVQVRGQYDTYHNVYNGTSDSVIYYAQWAEGTEIERCYQTYGYCVNVWDRIYDANGNYTNATIYVNGKHDKYQRYKYHTDGLKATITGPGFSAVVTLRH